MLFGMQLVGMDMPPRIRKHVRVLLWRAAQLSGAGYEPNLALDLALANDVDLHVATSLLARGCPQSTALRILW
jgi:hypothetical protein